ncbi:MAG TPA: hypothetical protein VNM16_11980 [Bacillota bacterium]|nr:hypothetical protein [Bacillota bacterium]
MSWYRMARTAPAPAPPWEPAADILSTLRACVGRRVALLWHCGHAVAEATGWIVQVSPDVVEVRGAVHTLGAGGRRGFPHGIFELTTVIPVRSICALIEDVPRGVRVDLPLMLPPGGGEGTPTP